MTIENVPQVSNWLQNGFHRYLRGFLKRNFHAVAIDRASRCDHALNQNTDRPLIIYANHPSWWDPLVAHFLNLTLFPTRQFYAPIDAQALEKYRVFAKLGFYGVDLETQSGAAAFLKQSQAILDTRQVSLWLTPEGRFTDARDHTVELMPGLAHLCSRLDHACVVPISLEYAFWEERLPVCLTMLGEPIDVANHADIDKSQWNDLLTDNMRTTQSKLAQRVMVRCSEPFDNLLRGKRGGGFFYDSMRRFKSIVTWRRFSAAHGEKFE